MFKKSKYSFFLFLFLLLVCLTVFAISFSLATVVKADEDREIDVLKIREELYVDEESDSEEKVEKKFPTAALFFVFGGMIFIGVAAYPLVKHRLPEARIFEKLGRGENEIET